LTKEEFQNQIVPAIRSLWPRAGLVAKRVRPANDHDAIDIRRYNEELAMGAEKNARVWRILNSYPVDDVMLIIRQQGDRHLDGDQRGGNYVLSAIRSALHDAYGPPPASEDSGAFRPRIDPARWTWQDEGNLWHVLGDLARRGREEDELHVCRKIVGKNPGINERDDAYRTLCKRIDETRKRAMERGLTQDEAYSKYLYPREAIESIREARARAAQAAAERKARAAEAERQAEAAQTAAAVAELDEIFGATGDQG
jgi:hypothetical protein